MGVASRAALARSDDTPVKDLADDKVCSCLGTENRPLFLYKVMKVKREQLRSKLRHDLAVARKETDRLFQMLSPKALYERPIAERHRIVFYLGHLETFDWNMICATSFGLPSFNSGFDRLFAFGIDPVDGGLPKDQPTDWPRVQEILEYNTEVRRTV